MAGVGCTWRPGSDDELARIAAAFGGQPPEPAPEDAPRPPAPAGDASPDATQPHGE